MADRVNGDADSDMLFEKSLPIFKIIPTTCSDFQRLQSWNIGQSGKCVSGVCVCSFYEMTHSSQSELLAHHRFIDVHTLLSGQPS